MADLNFYSDSPVLEEGVSQVTATPSVALGARRTHKGEDYVYMYNAGGGTAAQGNGVKFVTGASGYSIAATSLTDVFSPFAGVVKHVALASAEYGWVLTRGFASVAVVTASTADYKIIALGAAGKFIEASGTTTLGTAVAVGFLLSHNTAAAGTAYGFIRANV